MKLKKFDRAYFRAYYQYLIDSWKEEERKHNISYQLFLKDNNPPKWREDTFHSLKVTFINKRKRIRWNITHATNLRDSHAS